jgi:hypothetical protein
MTDEPDNIKRGKTTHGRPKWLPEGGAIIAPGMKPPVRPETNYTRAQFFGGHYDGQQRFLPGQPHTFYSHGLIDGVYMQTTYTRRVVNGVFATLENGNAPFDWIGDSPVTGDNADQSRDEGDQGT